MAEAGSGPAKRGRLKRAAENLLRPYTGEPPPGLYRPRSQDLLIRAVGTVVPHFLSVVMSLGDDQHLPDLPRVVNRRTMVITQRRLIARDDDVVELALADPDGAQLKSWHAGAHIDLHLPSGRIRQYSLCGDASGDREYRIAVRRIPVGGGGSLEAHTLEVGHRVEISDPRNAFMMPLPGSASRKETIRFIAGGIGITPVLPMVRLAARLGVPWSLCYTGRSRESLPFVDELLAFGDRVQIRTDDEHGLPAAAELLAGVDRRTAVFACGPPDLLEVVRRGIPLDSGTELHVERFAPLPVADGLPFQLELARTREVVDVAADQSALSALRGVRPNIGYSCQQGFCGSCVQQVIDGDVEHRDDTLTDRQRESGQMLVCVSRARSEGDRLVLDL
jgi:ferredoxin-NADP reductase